MYNSFLVLLPVIIWSWLFTLDFALDFVQINWCFAFQWKTDQAKVNKMFFISPARSMEGSADTQRRTMWVGEKMKHCHDSSVHTQQFPFPNNPPQCPPPLIIFLFLSHSPRLSFSRSPSSRFQLHYRIITAAGPHNMDSVTLVLLSLFTTSSYNITVPQDYI